MKETLLEKATFRLFIQLALIILGLFTLYSSDDHLENIKFSKKISDLDENIKVLNKNIIPKQGTKRKEVELVYGQPSSSNNSKHINKFVDSGFETDIYRLLTRNDSISPVSLTIIYQKESVFQASIFHPNLSGIKNSSKYGNWELEDKKIIFDNLLKIYNLHIHQLQKASWNNPLKNKMELQK